MASPVKIKVRTGSKTEDKTTAPAKPATTRKRPTASGQRGAKAAAARRGPSVRDQTGKPDGRSKKSANGAPVRRASKGIDARTEARLLKLVEKAGDRRTKAEAEHKESIDALHDAAREAIEGGVSMAKVADASGISRQWLYKMGDFEGRKGVTNGNGKPAPAKTDATRKAPAKRTSTRKAPAKPAATRRTGTRTRAAAKSTTRTRIRSRA
jgi:hypothetical protein